MVECCWSIAAFTRHTYLWWRLSLPIQLSDHVIGSKCSLYKQHVVVSVSMRWDGQCQQSAWALSCGKLSDLLNHNISWYVHHYVFLLKWKRAEIANTWHQIGKQVFHHVELYRATIALDTHEEAGGKFVTEFSPTLHNFFFKPIRSFSLWS